MDKENVKETQNNIDRLAVFEKSIETLREMLKVQCSDGNWNYDPYMHGMANGMLFALSLFDDKRPEYLTAPDIWICDIPDLEKTVECLRMIEG